MADCIYCAYSSEMPIETNQQILICAKSYDPESMELEDCPDFEEDSF